MSDRAIQAGGPDEMRILSLMSEKGKFAIEISYEFPTASKQDAFERLMLRDWIRLIDIGRIAAHPGLFRIFRVMPEAIAWFKERLS